MIDKIAEAADSLSAAQKRRLLTPFLFHEFYKLIMYNLAEETRIIENEERAAYGCYIITDTARGVFV